MPWRPVTYKLDVVVKSRLDKLCRTHGLVKQVVVNNAVFEEVKRLETMYKNQKRKDHVEL